MYLGKDIENIRSLNDMPIVNIYTDYVVGVYNDKGKLLITNATASSINIDIPSGINFDNGDSLLFLKADNNYDTVINIVNPSESIVGGSSYVMDTQYEFVQLTFDKVNNDWVISNTFVYDFIPPSGKQDSNPSLESIASLSLNANDFIFTTAPDTWTTASTTSFSRDLIGQSTYSNQRALLGLGTASTKDVGTSGNTVALLDGNNTWSNTVSFTSNTSAMLSFNGATNLGFYSESSNTLSLNNKNNIKVVSIDNTSLSIGDIGGAIDNGSSKTVFSMDTLEPPILYSGATFGVWLRVNEVDGKLLSFYRDTTEVGWIESDSTDIYYTTASDYRLKENVRNLDSYGITDKINSYKYKWKHNNKSSVGFIAHELQEHIPEAVVGEKDSTEYQKVDMKRILPFLVNDVKNLINDLTNLEEQLGKFDE